ncbi:MAG TPA: hypothetical protein VE690_04570 [Rhodopila sp.]|nr:hypothetical protein [Rhodopila sp.]
MLQPHTPAPRPAAALSDDEAQPFLRLAGSCAHALVVGAHPVPLICGLIRHGCRAAATIRPGEKPDEGDYDLLLIPRTADFPSLDHIVRLASRTLALDGRLVAAAPDAGTAAMLDRRLQLNGFVLSASAPHRTAWSTPGRTPGLLLRFDRRSPRS